MNELVILSNPRRRRKHKAKHRRRHQARRRSHSRGRRRVSVRARRNPIFSGGIFASAMRTIKEGALGAVGALASDALYGYTKGFLPVQLQAGYGRTGVKLAYAVLLGIAAGKMKSGLATPVAVGAATVTLHEMLAGLANSLAPSVPLGAYEDTAMLGYDSAQPLSAYMPGSQVGAYMKTPGAMSDLLPQ